jgi:hypothetical protein
MRVKSWLMTFWVFGLLAGCGVGIPRVAEIWDQANDPKATQHMEMQIKKAIYCELREAVWLARQLYYQRTYQGRIVSTAEDQPVPDSWGVQQTLTFTIQEVTSLNPGVSVNNLDQTFTFGLGGTLSSDATRIDKYDTFYTIAEIANVYSDQDVCSTQQPQILGPKSTGSSFLIISDLGIKEWLPQALAVSNFLRSSRADPSGVGPPLGASGFASDSISYDVKFVVVSSLNATPSWKLVRVSTATGPALFETSRTRTHNLSLTIGPGSFKLLKTKKGIVARTVGPSQSAVNAHQAQQIGNAVAAALRAGQIR